MKLVDVMTNQERGRGQRQSMAPEGSPCPFCDGERSVVVYITISVRRRNYRTSASDETGRDWGTHLARPSFWQGACLECAASIQDDLAERAKRYDYLRRVHGGEDQG